MSAFSLNITHHFSSNENKRILSIYLHRPDVTENEIDNKISAFIQKESPVDQINFVGFKNCLINVPQWFTDSSPVKYRLDRICNKIPSQVKLITFDEENGIYQTYDLKDQPDINSKQITADERQYQLLDMFIRNQGVIEPSPGFHYEKPSGKHVEKFIRVSNLLEEAGSYSIISFWLIYLVWKKDINKIIVDTTGILSIANILIYENQHRGGSSKLPVTWSHQSYDGLSSLYLTEPDNTIILISASTSGELQQKLIEKGAKSENIITLFYLNNDTGIISSLCNLTKNSSKNPNGIDPLINFEPENCLFCKKNSLAVKLVGDQFTFEPPPVSEIEIIFDDLSPTDREIVDQLAGLNFFRVFKKSQNRDFEIFLDIEKLFPSKEEDIPAFNRSFIKDLRTRWDGIIKRGMAIHLKRVIHATYDFSAELADSAKSVWHGLHKHYELDVFSTTQLNSVTPQPETASLVVVSCLDDGHELMSINRDLRSIQPDGNATYITPLFRASSSAIRNRIRANLTFGQHKADTFSLFRALEINLPDCNTKHSWNSEVEVLNKIIAWAIINEPSIPQELEERLAFLQEATSKGLTDKLFWNSIIDIPLKINADFTLIHTCGGTRNISQADIYVAISLVLHNYRSMSNSVKHLVYKPYKRTVISPETFIRFNDGVIHASFLRAVRNFELNYSNCTSNVSERMKNILLTMIKKIDHGDCEALVEFVLALLTNRLTMKKEHTLEVATLIINTKEIPEYLKTMSKFLIKNLELDT